MLRNPLKFEAVWEVVSTPPNLQAEGSPLVCCLWLLIPFIHSYPPYLVSISTCNLMKCHAMVTRDDPLITEDMINITESINTVIAESEGLTPLIPKPAIRHNLWASSVHCSSSKPRSLRLISMLSFHLLFDLHGGHLPRGFATKILCFSLLSLIVPTYTANLNLLDLTNPIIVGNLYKSLIYLLCNILICFLRSLFLSPDIFLNTLFSNTCSSL